MGFLTPAALALAALAIPIIIFYMLKLRRQPARVSSLMLWQQVIRDRQANTPWQRLKRNLLLLLQLLILALLVMALARPYLIVEARVQGNVVLLLDSSASMQATDVTPSRFAVAQTAALDLIDRLDPNDAVTLIAVENRPHVLASSTTDHGLLTRSINAAEASNGPADWDTALSLAAANASTLPRTTIVIISDGGLSSSNRAAIVNPESDDANYRLPFSNLPVEFIPVGQGVNNQGIVALSLRDGADGPELFLRVFNAAQEPARRLVEIQINDQLFDARWLDVPPGDSASLTLRALPPVTRQVQVALSGNDDLPLDDVAWAVRNTAPARVLLVGEGNLFLERALALLPDIEAQRASADQPLPESRFDLTIFDRAAPPAPAEAGQSPLPQGSLLFIAPPASTPLFEVRGTITQPQIAYLERGHPLLNYVELGNLHVGQAQVIPPPPWAQTLVEAKEAPLLMAGQVDGQRIAILSFDLHQSDLPLQIDFPILVVNLVRWLSPGGSLEQSQTLQPGQGFNLPTAASADSLLINLPSQEQMSIASDEIAFNDTFDLGIYQIFVQAAEQAETSLLDEFTVNLLAEEETNITPREVQSVSDLATAPEQATLTGRWEWWWTLLLLGLGVLLVEWWVYWRGEVR